MSTSMLLAGIVTLVLAPVCAFFAGRGKRVVFSLILSFLMSCGTFLFLYRSGIGKIPGLDDDVRSWLSKNAAYETLAGTPDGAGGSLLIVRRIGDGEILPIRLGEMPPSRLFIWNGEHPVALFPPMPQPKQEAPSHAPSDQSEIIPWKPKFRI